MGGRDFGYQLLPVGLRKQTASVVLRWHIKLFFLPKFLVIAGTCAVIHLLTDDLMICFQVQMMDVAMDEYILLLI